MPGRRPRRWTSWARPSRPSPGTAKTTLLSHGTAEQVYLLLRVALTDQLTRPGEVCPLILDDPTPHFDVERTVAMLDLLLQFAESRQVVLFSQETEVLAWAERHLKEPDHRLWRLPGRRTLT